MKIEIINTGYEYFVSLTDISKMYYKKYGKKMNVSQSIKNIPDKYIIKSRGRLSKTLIIISIIELYLNSRRNISREFINEILQNINQQDIIYNNKNSMETFFIDMLESFLKGMISNLKINRQYSLHNKVYDLCINDLILIEFDEEEHVNNKENDLLKYNLANKYNYYLIRVKSKSNYGYEISSIYKQVKKLLL